MSVHDGRFANNAWLQELPDFILKQQLEPSWQKERKKGNLMENDIFLSGE